MPSPELTAIGGTTYELQLFAICCMIMMIIPTNILADYEGAKLRTTQAVEGTGGQRQQYKARLFTRYMRQSTACVDRRHQQAADSTTTAASQPYESADAKSILAKPAILEPSHYSLLVALHQGGVTEDGGCQ